MTQEFTFDQTKVPQLKERLRRRLWKIIIPVFLVVMFIEIFTLGHSIDKVLLIVMIALPVVVLWTTVRSAINNVIGQYQTYRIVLSDKGVESYFKTKKTLDWGDIKCDIKESGEIILINSNVNWLLRQFSEKWTILIPPELANYDKLRKIITEKATWK